MIAGTALSPAMLRWPVAVLLVGLGIRQLYRHLHPRWAAMRVGMGGLTLWSFLMASAHGAGLMVLPVFLSMTVVAGGPSCHARGASTQASAGAMATLVHGLGYLAVTALIAWFVVDRLGLGPTDKGGAEVATHAAPPSAPSRADAEKSVTTVPLPLSIRQ